MKILVIGDNISATKTLRNVLHDYYTIEVADSGYAGLSRAKANGYELVIIDLTVSNKTGIVICKALRARSLTIPILALSDQNLVADKITALNSGADDCLARPFNGLELLARIRALLRRPVNILPTTGVTIGDLVINEPERVVTYKGKQIELRRREFDLLEYLIRYRGQVITRTMILNHVWSRNANQFSNTVDVHVKYLRDKIDRRFNIPLIQTVPGVGYKVTL